MFPILNPSPSSLPVPSLWVVPVHQPQASSIVHRTWTGDSFHIWYYTCCIKSTDKMSAMVVIMLSIKIQTRLIETGLHLVSSPVSFRLFNQFVFLWLPKCWTPVSTELDSGITPFCSCYFFPLSHQLKQVGISILFHNFYPIWYVSNCLFCQEESSVTWKWTKEIGETTISFQWRSGYTGLCWDYLILHRCSSLSFY